MECRLTLIVQNPCHNEEDTLPQTVADIPYEIEGLDRVEILIVDWAGEVTGYLRRASAGWFLNGEKCGSFHACQSPTRISTSYTPSFAHGMSASVRRSVPSSLKWGIWTITFNS